MSVATLTTQQWMGLNDAVGDGARRAARGLEEMTGRPIAADVVNVSLVPLGALIPAVGRAEEPATAVYLGIHDDVDGHLMLLLTDEAAARMADLLLDQPDGTTAALGEMEASALQEATNVAGSFFLTALADATGLTIHPTPPVLVQDMCGAILDGPVAMLAMAGDEALLIETEFRQDERHIAAHLLVLPDGPSLVTLLGRLA
jgi:chemotaxis protein CheC